MQANRQLDDTKGSGRGDPPVRDVVDQKGAVCAAN